MINNIEDKNLILNEIAVDTTIVEEVIPGETPTVPPITPPTAEINCSLEVALKTNNIAVYVCKGSKQCFNFTALKCCGEGKVTIKGTDSGWRDGVLVDLNFGKFELNNSGICFTPYSKLMADDSKTITFEASSCGVTTEFDVTFVYDPCKCCCGCRS